MRRNLDIEGGWVNGILAVVTHLHDNCIIVQKLTNPSHRHPIPRFRQRIEVHGASYSIMRQQFPLQLAYGVTVHRVQGATVQRAIVCLSEMFFETGQAYVALSRVRKLEDLVLWDFEPAAIKMLPFYRQLLEWCDATQVNPMVVLQLKQTSRPKNVADLASKPVRSLHIMLLCQVKGRNLHSFKACVKVVQRNKVKAHWSHSIEKEHLSNQEVLALLQRNLNSHFRTMEECILE